MKPIHVLCAVIIIIFFLDEVFSGHAYYQYKRYTYKKKRDDRKYKSAKSLCETKQDCLQKRGVEQTICIRKCVSPFCYNELYGDDPLEEGEIDVRFNSFKGCLQQDKMVSNRYSQGINDEQIN